ncbi:MAG: RidA family protein [Deltaproteobacteria bacterium]|nr:RidA family protein [Myxococcales bacterium]MCZ6570576.1 RidA family protein [Deltaproteobacteria bacterium]MCZ6821601.1 RidA family protein [Deltaproteobacteria bacterium]
MDHVLTENAPAPIGPYSQAVGYGDLVFLSGQIPLDPETGERHGDSIEEQAEQVLRNLESVLDAAGASWETVLRVTVYMTQLEEFSRFNAVYERMLRGAQPARSTVQVSALPLGVRLEIDAIASRTIR